MPAGAADARPPQVLRLAAIKGWQRHLPALDAIVFAASATQSFARESDRQAFRQRWLGRYLEHHPECAFLAFDGQDFSGLGSDCVGTVAGYIVGALRDPANDPLFADIPYFRELSPLTARVPGHLHINLAADARNRGLGGQLIAAFCAHAQKAGAPGVHAVTAENARNRSFYARNGFALAATTQWNGQAIVFLARAL